MRAVPSETVSVRLEAGWYGAAGELRSSSRRFAKPCSDSPFGRAIYRGRRSDTGFCRSLNRWFHTGGNGLLSTGADSGRDHMGAEYITWVICARVYHVREGVESYGK